MFGVDRHDLHGTHVLDAEHLTAHLARITEPHVLRTNPKRQLAFHGTLTQCGHSNRLAVHLDALLTGREAGGEPQKIHGRATDESGDMHGQRPVVDVLRASDLSDHPVVHYSYAIRHCHRLGLIVRHVDGRGTYAIVQGVQLSAHQVAKFGVQSAERLVPHATFGAPYQGTAQRPPPAVTPGPAGPRTP